LKVIAQPILEILSFANINNFVGLVKEAINARVLWNITWPITLRICHLNYFFCLAFRLLANTSAKKVPV
jgi:hypothetical protein